MANNEYQCRRKFLSEKNSVFPVAVRLPSEGNKITIMQLWLWPVTKLKSPDASLMLPVANNQDKHFLDGKIYVISDTPTSQTISVHGNYEASAFVHITGNFKYETNGETIAPVSSKIIRDDLATGPSTFIAGSLFAFFIRYMALWWRRRLLQPRVTAER
jgi:hypothetical protein